MVSSRFGGLRWRLGLRWTLLLALLPLITLPWIGLRFVERMAELARNERLENQTTAARALAASLHERRELFELGPGAPRLPAGAQALAVERVAAGEPVLWAHLPWRELPVRMSMGSQNQFRVRIAAARHDDDPTHLLLAVQVDDERLVPPVAGADPGTGDLLNISAGPEPGQLTLQQVRLTEREGGWGAELSLEGPPALLHIHASDVDYLGNRRIEAESDSGLLAPTMPPGPHGLTTDNARQEAMWGDTLRALARVSGRVSVYDINGVLRAQQGSLVTAMPAPAGWQGRLAQLLLSAALRMQPEPDEQRDSPDPSSVLLSPLARALAGAPGQQVQRAGIQGGMPAWILTSANPIWVGDHIVGALMLEENTATRLVLGQEALERLTLLAALAVGASVVALLLVASITVGRVVRLRNEAESAIDQRGRVVRMIRSTALADELGDLRSSYARVLDRLREHQEYLANLRSRLVHELRTPIMVVRSSLENLADESSPTLRGAYIERVQAGAARLERIVSSMGEASSLETMLADSELEDVDLPRLLAACADGYRSAFAPRRFELRIGPESAACRGVPEAIAQALDKLVSNAIDFATPETPIVLTLVALREAALSPETGPHPTRSGLLRRKSSPTRPGGGDRSARREPGTFWQLTVSNQGPSLPRNMGESLLDQMVSVRGERQSEQSHLGLGLYLVRLIAEFHGGEAFAHNIPGGVEAGFTLRASGAIGPVVPTASTGG